MFIRVFVDLFDSKAELFFYKFVHILVGHPVEESPCTIFVQYTGGVQYIGGVQYTGEIP